MDQNVAKLLMARAIDVAKMSQAEDDRLHPKVGAVLADEQGKELLFAYRGMDGNGGHAEFILLNMAARRRISLKGKTLFVTLEPCSRRSIDKKPRVVRVAESGISTVYIGSLDPNPQIIGRGVHHLTEMGVTVEHFPAELRKELGDLNVTFHGQHGYLVDPIIPNVGEDIAARQRSGVLATTLEMIASSKGEVMIFAGDTSWLNDLFVGLLEASLNGQKIRLISQKTLEELQYKRLAAIGIEVCDVADDSGIRATLTLRGAAAKQLLVVEREPARHAQLFSAPHDNAVLSTFLKTFNDAWSKGAARPATKTADLRDIPIHEIAVALRNGVPIYKSAKIHIDTIDISDLKFLTNDVEILKLRRAASTLRIMNKHGRRAPLGIAGTPWAFFPPIVERNPNGRLVLIDGIHRVYEAIQRKEEKIEVIVVNDVDAELPATPVEVFEPNFLPRKRDRQQRYSNYRHEAFRPIRQALERGEWANRI